LTEEELEQELIESGFLYPFTGRGS
jgi:hypothetical protein